MSKIERSNILDIVIVVIAVVWAVYQMVYTQTVIFRPDLHQNNHLGFALLTVFLTALRKRRRLWPLMLVLIVASMVSIGYAGYFYHHLKTLTMPSTADLIVGVILMVVVFEATRQSFGWVLLVVTAIFLAYICLGQYLPPPLWHVPLALSRIIPRMGIGFHGIYGSILGLSANYLFLFILFGTLMRATGAAAFFMELGKLAGSKLAGGPAITAVISSAFVGSATGSAAANIAITGSFTIPLMKRVGYTPEKAGAIEAVASSGGQIMPPVMGATAFVMASFLGMRYIHVCAMAAIPATLYFLSAGLHVQLTAVKSGLRPPPEKVDIGKLLAGGPLFVLPLAVLTYLLIVGFSPNYAAFWAVVSSIGLAFVMGIVRRGTVQPLRVWIQSIVEGATTSAQIAVSCGIMGVILACVTGTGIGLTVPSLIDAISGGNIIVVYLLTAGACVILGTGVATLPVYILVALMVAPVFAKLGVSLPQAHLFVLFFAVFAMISPPIAPGALIASALARGSYIGTAIEAVKVGAAAYLLPFMFIYAPVLVLRATDPISGVMGIIASLALVLTLQVSVVGVYLAKLNLSERAASIVSAVLLTAYFITQNYMVFGAGAGLCLLLTLQQLAKKRRMARLVPVEGTGM